MQLLPDLFVEEPTEHLSLSVLSHCPCANGDDELRLSTTDSQFWVAHFVQMYGAIQPAFVVLHF